MAQLALGVVGAAFGGLVGGPIGAKIGFTVGSAVGGQLFQPDGPDTVGPRRSDTGTMRGDEGAPLPIPYGTKRYNAIPIWEDPQGLEEIATKSESGGGKGGPPGGSQTTFTYTWTAAFAFTEGEITSVRRVWANKKLIYDGRDDATAESLLAVNTKTDSLTIYNGGETQTADPIIQSFEGAGNVPGFRGICYVVIEGLDATNGRQNIEAEVVRGAVIDAPVRITEFSTPIATDNAQYSNGVFQVPQYGSVTSGRISLTVTSYDLNGEVVETSIRSGTTVNGSDNVSVFPIKNLVNTSYMRQNAAGTGPGVSAYWLASHGGVNDLVGGAPNAWSADVDVFGTGGVVDHYYGFANPILFDGWVFAENDGSLNQWGIARYAGTITDDLPQNIADIFYGLDSHLAGGSTSVPRINLSGGDDGYLYGALTSGTGFFDDGTEVLQWDTELNLIKSFSVEGGVNPHNNLAVWQDKMVAMTPDTLIGGGVVRMWDISDEALAANGNEAPLIGGPAAHNAPIADGALTGIGGGLFIMGDGIWSMTEQVALAAPTLQSVVEEICTRTGLSIGEVDASDLDQVVHGYCIDRPMPAARAIDSLYPSFFFDVFESNGQIKFTKRGGSSVVTIPADDLGAFVSSPPQSALVRLRQQEMELPQEVDFEYSDRNQRHQKGAQRARRIITTSTNAVTLSTAVSMSSGEAAKVVEIFLQSAWTERVQYNFTLTRKYMYLDPADLITITIPTGDLLVRITSAPIGANGVIEIASVADLSTLYSSVAAGNDADNEEDPLLGIVGPTKLTVVDSAILRSFDDGPGYYLAGAGLYSGWSGASVWRDDAGFDVGLGFIASASICGSTTSKLGDGDGNMIDVYASVNVALVNSGALSSVTAVQFLAGVNVAMIGDELIFFKDATLEVDGSYTLRHLLRGRGGTPMIGHSEDTERFVFLDADHLINVDGSLSDSGTLARFRALSVGDSSASPTTDLVTLTNGRIIPNAPVHAYANVGADGAFQGIFVRSARLNTDWRPSVDVPLDEPTELYELDVLDDLDAVVRTINIGPERSFTYTSAEQLADHGSFRAANDFDIYQISDRVGRGKAGRFTGTTPDFLPSAYRTEVISDSPIMYWPLGRSMEELIIDSPLQTGSGDEGTLFEFNGDSPTLGGYGSAKYLADGATFWSDNYADLNLLLDEVSIEFWLKTSLETTDPNHRNIVSRGDLVSNSGNDSCFFCFLQSGNLDDIRCIANPAGAPLAQGLSTSGAGLNDGSWHHAVWQWDNPAAGGTNKMYIYVDGGESANVAIAAAAGVALETSATRDLEAFLSTGTIDNLVGNIAHVAIYDRVLSAAEILAHYEAWDG